MFKSAPQIHQRNSGAILFNGQQCRSVDPRVTGRNASALSQCIKEQIGLDSRLLGQHKSGVNGMTIGLQAYCDLILIIKMMKTATVLW